MLLVIRLTHNHPTPKATLLPTIPRHWHPFPPTMHTTYTPTLCRSTAQPPHFSSPNHKLKLRTYRNEQYAVPPAPPFKPPSYTTSSSRITSLWGYPVNYKGPASSVFERKGWASPGAPN